MKFNTPRGPGFLELRIQVHNTSKYTKNLMYTAPDRIFSCQVRRSTRSFVQLLSSGSQFHQIFIPSTMDLSTWLLLDYLHSAKLLLDYSHLLDFLTSIDNLSTWTLPKFTISLIKSFSRTTTGLPYIYHNLMDYCMLIRYF